MCWCGSQAQTGFATASKCSFECLQRRPDTAAAGRGGGAAWLRAPECTGHPWCHPGFRGRGSAEKGACACLPIGTSLLSCPERRWLTRNPCISACFSECRRQCAWCLGTHTTSPACRSSGATSLSSPARLRQRPRPAPRRASRSPARCMLLPPWPSFLTPQARLQTAARATCICLRSNCKGHVTRSFCRVPPALCTHAAGLGSGPSACAGTRGGLRQQGSPDILRGQPHQGASVKCVRHLCVRSTPYSR